MICKYYFFWLGKLAIVTFTEKWPRLATTHEVDTLRCHQINRKECRSEEVYSETSTWKIQRSVLHIITNHLFVLFVFLLKKYTMWYIILYSITGIITVSGVIICEKQCAAILFFFLSFWVLLRLSRRLTHASQIITEFPWCFRALTLLNCNQINGQR